MTKPVQYREVYVVSRNLPYQMIESLPTGRCSSGGVLGKGRKVWMKKHPSELQSARDVKAYAEEIGIILLDPRLLSPLNEQRTGEEHTGISTK